MTYYLSASGRGLFGISAMAGLLVCGLFLVPLAGYFFRRFFLVSPRFPEGDNRLLWMCLTLVFVMGAFICGMELMYLLVGTPVNDD